MMSYCNGYVCSVLNHNNRAFREFNENGVRTCIVPFGSEYKLRIKNSNYNRIKVKIFIDGMDICSNEGGLVLNSKQTLDLERFIDDLDSGKKFKFISTKEGKDTGEIQDPTNPENGTIRFEIHPEKDFDPFWSLTTTSGTFTSSGEQNVNIKGTTTKTTIPIYESSAYSSPTAYYINSDLTTNTCSVDVLDTTDGATSEGSNSNQSFMEVSDFETDMPTIIELKLRGPSHQTVSDQVTQKWQLEMRKGKPHAVYMNESMFVCIKDKGISIKINNDGLCVAGNGINIKTTEYSIK